MSTRKAHRTAGSETGPPRPLRVGLTGNIASGKTTVARVWERLGAAVISADELSRRAVEPGTAALRQIVETFGTGCLDADGRLDRSRLRELVFRDEDARRRLEAIVHPHVASLRKEAESEAVAGGAPVIVHEIPLLFEVGLQDEFDAIVVVDAPADERERRLARDRGLDRAEARRMIASQVPIEEKRCRADLVIDNVGSPEALEASAEAAWRRLLELRAQRGGQP